MAKGIDAAAAVHQHGQPLFAQLANALAHGGGDAPVGQLVAHQQQIQRRGRSLQRGQKRGLVTMVAAYLSRIDQCWERGRQAALTATAAADRRLDRRRQRVAKGVERVLRVEDARLVSTNARVARAAHRSVTHATAAVDRSAAAVRTRSTRAVEVAGRDLDGLAARVRAHDPVHALARGWSITTDQQGRAVRSITGLEAGAVITTRVADGTLTSKVIATTPATTDSATTAPDPVPGAPDE